MKPLQDLSQTRAFTITGYFLQLTKGEDNNSLECFAWRCSAATRDRNSLKTTETNKKKHNMSPPTRQSALQALDTD